MDISSVSSVTNTSSSSGYLSDVTGKDEFLKLLVTQLENQDPLNPQDSSEFTAQLATFSSLEQLISLNSGVQTLQMLELANANTLSLQLIGKQVSASGESISLEGGSANAVSYELEGEAESVTIGIYDADGNLVKTIYAGEQGQGTQEFTWDGTDENGSVAADGQYSFEVVAVNSEGDTVNATSYFTGIVTGITFEDGLTYAIVDGKKVSISDIIEVLTPQEDVVEDVVVEEETTT